MPDSHSRIIDADTQIRVRILIHIPHGILAVLLKGWKSLAFTAAFLVYELNQDRHKDDKAFKDIYGYMAGMAIGYIGKRLYRWVR